MQTLWPCVTINHCLLSGVHSQGSISPETQLNAAINDTQQKPTGGKITDSLLISAISQTWKCCFREDPHSASTCGAATPNPVSVWTLCCSLLWSEILFQRVQAIKFCRMEKKMWRQRARFEKWEKWVGTLRNKTLMSGWRKASSLFPDSDDLHAQKSHVMKSTFWKKKRRGYDENSHKHYNVLRVRVSVTIHWVPGTRGKSLEVFQSPDRFCMLHGFF